MKKRTRWLMASLIAIIGASCGGEVDDARQSRPRGSPVPVKGDGASCEGACGDRAPAGCWCDALCHSYNDCCADKVQVCDAPPDPCEGVSCDQPPAAECIDGSTLRTYADWGTCSDGQCAYGHTDTPCAEGCDPAAAACIEPPPCDCTTVPEPTCADTETLRTFEGPGTCSDGQCQFAHQDRTCAFGCDDSACLGCSWERVFEALYGQAFSGSDLAFVTDQGKSYRGLDKLNIAEMSSWSSYKKVHVIGDPQPVVKIQLWGTNAYQVLANREGAYVFSLKHAMWSEANGNTGHVAKTLLRQMAMSEPTQQRLAAILRILAVKAESKIPGHDLPGYRTAVRSLVADVQSGSLTIANGTNKGILTTRWGGDRQFKFQFSTSFGRPLELGVWPTDQSWGWRWVTYDVPPSCDGCTQDSFDGANLLYCAGPLTWNAAEQRCQALGGHLASLSSEAQNALAVALSPHASPNIWIGLSDQELEGKFVWSDGQPVTYTNWVAGQPDDYQGAEDCVHLWWKHLLAATWNDMACNQDAAYVCRLP